MLRVLDPSGAIVTIDAAGYQVENARIIRAGKGHYLLAVKRNQPKLREAVEAAFERDVEADFGGVRCDGDDSIERGHGRHEERSVTVIYGPTSLPEEWPDVAAVVQVNRQCKIGIKTTVTTHHYLSNHEATAKQFAGWVRGHWRIENGLHWVLDVVFGEDRSRVKVRNAGANLAISRRVAVSSVRRARVRAAE